jgi:hypothetical protein
MRPKRSRIPLLVLCTWLGASLPAQGQEREDSATARDPSFWRAAAGILATNALTWSHNWYVRRWHWANVGTRVWWENIHSGFVWDDDDFMANQLAHPYHGSLYFNSARASGYEFWQAAPYVAAGSISWELFTENVEPSLNDLINTTLGGIALGEVTYRLSALLRSSPGSERNGISREVGSFALSPIARTQGLLDGRGRERKLAADSQPAGVGSIAIGVRSGDGVTNRIRPERTFVELALRVGSPFDANVSRPYDAFDFGVRLSPETQGIIVHLGISGLLTRRDLSRSSRNHLVLGLFQHYQYDDVPAHRFGGQSVSGALLYRRHLEARTQVDLGMHVEGLLLGGISSDYRHTRRRDYDYGPGMGARLTASLGRDGRDLVRFDGRILWLHSVYGSAGDHVATFARLGAAVPLRGFVKVGGDVSLMTRHSHYLHSPSVIRRMTQVRAYLMWRPS